jgi:hypothetical protein
MLHEENAMNTKQISGWFFGAALAAGALWLRPAAAEDVLLVEVHQNNPASCLNPGSNNSFYGEAWGYDVAGTRKICEVSVLAGSFGAGGGMCTGLGGILDRAVKQKAVITIRNNATRAFVALKAQDTTTPMLSFTHFSSAIYKDVAHCGDQTYVSALTAGAQNP